jgi:hypothetical protein
VLFTYPADDGKNYRIDVVVSRPVKSPAVKGIEVWFLARNGKAVPLKKRSKASALVESVLGGWASTDAVFLFAPAVAYSELVGVVVSVDGKLNTFKLPAWGPKSSDKP